MSSIKVLLLGGDGGGPPFPRQLIRELGLRSGIRIDEIRINNNRYGSDGGSDRGSIILDDDEYITTIDAWSGQEVDALHFTTNLGNSIGGGEHGGHETKLSHVRVIAMGGRSGQRLDKLEVMYIEDYKPSSPVKEYENAGFIVSYTAPFQKQVKYTNSQTRTLDSYEKVTESMMNRKYSASVEGEYYVKAAASTDIEIRDTSVSTVKKELETEMSKATTTTSEIPEGHVGVSLVRGRLMKGNDGRDNEYWVYPTSDLSYSVIKTTDAINMRQHFDLTGMLYTQMPDLAQHKTDKYSYVYYS